MFTIPAAACAATFCAIYFGTVDWKSGFEGDCFRLNTISHRAICLKFSDSAIVRANIKKIIGKKTVACFGQDIGGRAPRTIGDCYIETDINAYASVSEEMHKRGL